MKKTILRQPKIHEAALKSSGYTQRVWSASGSNISKGGAGGGS